MANRKQLINRHSGIENNLPIGDLNLGEIGINHCNVTDAAIYVETNKDNPSSATLATFITEKAINNKINNVVELIENLTDTVELIDSGLTIEIERATSAETALRDAVELIDSSLTIEIERATSAETALRETIEENEEIISAALNDLNEKIQSISSVEVIDCGTY